MELHGLEAVLELLEAYCGNNVQNETVEEENVRHKNDE